MHIAAHIDWAALGASLATGDISGLDARVGAEILKASESWSVRRAARRAKISQLLFVIGLLARAVADNDRHAARVARSILGGVSDRLAAHVADRLGLGGTERNSAA